MAFPSQPTRHQTSTLRFFNQELGWKLPPLNALAQEPVDSIRSSGCALGGPDRPEPYIGTEPSDRQRPTFESSRTQGARSSYTRAAVSPRSTTAANRDVR